MGMGEAMRGEKYFHCNHGGEISRGIPPYSCFGYNESTAVHIFFRGEINFGSKTKE